MQLLAQMAIVPVVPTPSKMNPALLNPSFLDEPSAKGFPQRFPNVVNSEAAELMTFMWANLSKNGVLAKSLARESFFSTKTRASSEITATHKPQVFSNTLIPLNTQAVPPKPMHFPPHVLTIIWTADWYENVAKTGPECDFYISLTIMGRPV